MTLLDTARTAVLIVFSTVLPATAVWSQVASNEIPLHGISEKVTVRRDGRYVPYIDAANDADLYFTQGYVTASDRLWQMELLRRVARGETAELFGKAALEEDTRWRRFGFARVAEESIANLTPDLRAALENYARGVNAYIAALNDKTLPVEFRILQFRPAEWKPSDTVVIGKVMADALSTTWRSDLVLASMQSLPKDTLQDLTNKVTPYDVVLFGKDTGKPAVSAGGPSVSDRVMAAAERDEDVRKRSLERVGLYAEDLAASNNWVVSGKRTADGKPILANDPHLPANAPGIWYMTQLSTPTMRVAGVTIPGVPGIILGHNDFIAWGATNVGPDVQDLYVETFDGTGKYKTPSGMAEPVIRREDIKVRTNLLKPETQTVTVNVVETRNGPVILEDSGKKYALKWTAFDPKNNEFGAFFSANRARDWNDFKSALRNYGGAAQNFVYADVKGNIGWYAAGRIPVRRKGSGAMPYDGSTADGDWIGSIPFDELPNLYNPPSGFITTANQRTAGTGYKYFDVFSRDASTPWRSRRIYDRLSANSNVTMDDVRDIQYDILNIPLLNLSKAIVKLGAASDATLRELRTWDGKMTADSKAALLSNEINGCLATTIAADNKPVSAGLIRDRILFWAIEQQSPRWLPKAYSSYSELLRSCDRSSRAALADPKRLGPDEAKWSWGAVWRSRFSHPLAAAPLIGGQFATPNVPLDGSRQTPNVGSSVSMRHIASPGNWDATRLVIPLGESGDPASPYFRDQFDSWKNGTPMTFPFSPNAIASSAQQITVFKPQ